MPTLPELYAARFQTSLPLPAAIRPPLRAGRRRARIEMRAAQAKLHPSLPKTDLWTYEGTYPGPTLELRSGESVEVEWANAIQTKLPVSVVHTPKDDAHPPQNSAGVEADAKRDAQFDKLPAWTVVHVHGGRTDADADGWPENVTQAGRSVAYTYQIDANDRAKMLWYHDHAMSVTRLNVYAGLAGLWMIRDAEDDAVCAAVRKTRPRGTNIPAEIPMLIQDRNLETSAGGQLTGRLLHKVEDLPLGDPGPLEFFGPITVVNGAAWPYASLRRLPYRLRVINGCNARVYRLVLQDEGGSDRDTDGRPYNDYVRQIGTDGGLLGAPVELPADGLVLASGERADLILDLSTLPNAVKKLRWVNTAPVPFANDAAPGTAADAEAGRLVDPDVMEFRVGAKVAGSKTLALPSPLSSFQRLTHAAIGQHHEHRLVALVEVEKDMGGGVMKPMLELRELRKLDAPPAALDPGKHLQLKSDPAGPVVVYEMLPAGFNDPINFVVERGSTEAWKFLNLTGDTHPMHVHLTQFQISDEKGRVAYTVPANLLTDGGVVEVNTAATPAIDENEVGWKDTIRVNPGEMVTVLAPFDSRAGRYVYHCHILEHEDHEMMRPFLVMPAEIAAEMGHPGLAAHAAHAGGHT